ncbi:MAG: PilZ domain-containing protein, partial [bacterium]
LKAYREERAEAPVATICQEQQRYYRAELNWPATIVSGGEVLEVRLLNISVGGAAVAIPTLLPPGGVVKLLFTLPDKTTSAEIPGRIAWSNTDGEHGIQFGDLAPQVRTTLERWLHARMKEEGWHTECAS